MQDRVSQYPGRVKLTPVDGGDPVLYDMEWADNPTVTGTALNKANLLGDLAAEVYSLDTETATVNDAFLAVARKIGLFPVFLHVTVGGETPLAGLPIVGVTNLDGSALSTDGVNTDYFCAAESASVTVTMNGNYVDLPNKSVSGRFQDGGALDLTLAIPAKTAKTKVFNSSSSIKFSPYTTSVDVCCIGGGGGGGGAYSSVGHGESSAVASGGGGGGGHLVNQNGITVEPNKTYSIIVGSGGSAGKTTGISSSTTSGGTGGASRFKDSSTTLVSANGGSGGTKGDETSGNDNGTGGSGNGRGGNGNSNGSASTDGYIFKLSSLGKAGGGGGGGTASTKPKTGGDPNGGDGAYYLNNNLQIQNAESGTAPGGGGGGGFTRHYMDTPERELVNGAAGGRGAVYVRWGA